VGFQIAERVETFLQRQVANDRDRGVMPGQLDQRHVARMVAVRSGEVFEEGQKVLKRLRVEARKFRLHLRQRFTPCVLVLECPSQRSFR
jgi:hypothetical protein